MEEGENIKCSSLVTFTASVPQSSRPAASSLWQCIGWRSWSWSRSGEDPFQSLQAAQSEYLASCKHPLQQDHEPQPRPVHPVWLGCPVQPWGPHRHPGPGPKPPPLERTHGGRDAGCQLPDAVLPGLKLQGAQGRGGLFQSQREPCAPPLPPSPPQQRQQRQSRCGLNDNEAGTLPGGEGPRGLAEGGLAMWGSGKGEGQKERTWGWEEGMHAWAPEAAEGTPARQMAQRECPLPHPQSPAPPDFCQGSLANALFTPAPNQLWSVGARGAGWRVHACPPTSSIHPPTHPCPGRTDVGAAWSRLPGCWAPRARPGVAAPGDRSSPWKPWPISGGPPSCPPSHPPTQPPTHQARPPGPPDLRPQGPAFSWRGNTGTSCFRQSSHAHMHAHTCTCMHIHTRMHTHT